MFIKLKMRRFVLTVFCLSFSLFLRAESEEAIDYSFNMNDVVLKTHQPCSAKELTYFQQQAKQILHQKFEFKKVNFIVDEVDSAEFYNLLTQPFEISQKDFSQYTSSSKTYAKYRLIILSMYIPNYSDHQCYYGFAVFPEGWNGQKWYREKSNQKLEQELINQLD